MSNEQIPMDGTEQSYAYQAETPDPIQEAVTNAEQSVVASADEVNAAKERAAFETYVQTSGESIPSNYKDAGTWFDSLKEAQGQYTQARQELADVKEQYSKDGPLNPNYVAPETAEPTTETPTEQLLDPAESLRIPDQPEPTPETTEVKPIFEDISKEDWDQWSYEVAATGELLEETKTEIMSKTGLSEGMVLDFVAGQRAKMREAYGQASSVVGGKESLDNILRWAATTMTKEEQYSINAGLATKSLQDITLRGLEAKYKIAQNSKATSSEPATRNPQAEPIASTNPAFVGYRTMREFRQDRGDPRFGIEPQFRGAVEQRMMRTDFNNIPE
jgi:Fe-S cluster biosynthesis and repair protein YggX